MGKLTSWLSPKSMARITPAAGKKKITPDIQVKTERLRALANLYKKPENEFLMRWLSERLIVALNKPRIAAVASLDIYNAEIEGRKRELVEAMNELKTAEVELAKLEGEYDAG